METVQLVTVFQFRYNRFSFSGDSMSVSTQSTLSVKRILLTMAILLLVPVFRRVVSMFISIEAIADMFSLNITAWILILYDWNLLGVHYNRAKDHIGEAVL